MRFNKPIIIIIIIIILSIFRLDEYLKLESLCIAKKIYWAVFKFILSVAVPDVVNPSLLN